MGGNNSTPKPNTERQDTLPTAAPAASSAPCLSNSRNKEHLILAFCVGVLLTLLLMAFIFLIIKSYRKYRERLPISPGSLLRWVPLLSGTVAGHPKPQALDPHTDPPAMLSSIPEDSPVCANMTFKHSEEKSNRLAENHAADFDPIVYAQIKVKN
uniref:Chromosome 1 open reading frame 162 n=1 Tax=Callithrix jacchus TaxID=9483 RepID=F7G137_CALJA